MILLIRLLRSWIGVLSTEEPAPGRLSRVWRAVLLVPPFGTVLVLLWLRLAIKGPTTIRHRARFGAVFRCHLPDLIQMYIALFGVWEPDLTALIEERLGPGDVFVDVGANIGYYSLLASARVGPDGNVVAIDALPANHAELERNLRRNAGTENVRAVNRAVADKAGSLEVYPGPPHNLGLATTASGRGRSLRRESVSVPSAPLSELLEQSEIRRARVVKIDVEGGEPAVLAGLGAFLQGCRADVEIFLELSPAWWSDAGLTPEAVIRPLREAGFTVYLMENSYWPWRYLWPRAVCRPRRVARLPDDRVKRLDLVLSRQDAPELPAVLAGAAAAVDSSGAFRHHDDRQPEREA